MVDNSLPIAQVARELGVNDTTLGFWVKGCRKKIAGEPLPADMPETEQVRELQRRMLPTQAMTDASDLVLRMGRLVWDDPHWTPARSRRAPQRDPAALAPGTGAVVTVVAAVH